MAEQRHILIIGGGLAGLAAGCYARASGFRTTVVEHNLALGGVCTAWSRGPYTVDGCIHWLTGGPFDQLYRELGILSRVGRHTLETFSVYRDVRDGSEVAFGRDLDAWARRLKEISPDDAEEIDRMVAGARALTHLDFGVDRSPDQNGLRAAFDQLWAMRRDIPVIARFRKPLGRWTERHLRSERLRRVLTTVMGEEVPTFFVLMVLGYLSAGYLSRPDGGTARFRDALIATYEELGGESRVHATVDEVLVDGNRATGVRLADGTIVRGDLVVSTASAPETVLRLLGGRYAAEATRERLSTWKLFDPIVLATFGVANPLEGVPPTLLLDGIEPFSVGDRRNDRLLLRIFNDDPALAPAGHTIVQTMVPTSYDWWATRGSRYVDEKTEIAELLLGRIVRHLPEIAGAVRMTDVATPLTYWNMARSWRGSYEGWMPPASAVLPHIDKKLPGLDGFYMAGQWVEPGGGVPMAVMSGRQVIQLVCHDANRPFEVPRRVAESARPTRPSLSGAPRGV